MAAVFSASESLSFPSIALTLSDKAVSTIAFALSFPTGLIASIFVLPSVVLLSTPAWSLASSIAFLASSAAFLASALAAVFSASESLSFPSIALTLSDKALSTIALALSLIFVSSFKVLCFSTTASANFL